MSVKIDKTNAARLLDRAHVAYELIPYPVDEQHLDAIHVAEALGEDIRCVFKTLILQTSANEHFVCVVPGAAEVDLKKAAKAAAAKKADLIPMKELLPLTGYIRGGCSPIGLKKPFPIFIQAGVEEFEAIFISAGRRGLQLRIAPADLIAFTGATVADLIKTTEQ